MTLYRVLTRRHPQGQAYTFALCHTVHEAEEAADLAELLRWPVIEFEIVSRPKFPQQRTIEPPQPEPKRSLFDWLFGTRT